MAVSYHLIKKKEKISELVSLIGENRQLFSYGSRYCTELFSLSNQSIYEVDTILKENNYDELLDEVLTSVVTEKMVHGEKSFFDKKSESGVEIYPILMQFITQNLGGKFMY